jgi:hypothetical protein
VYFYFVRIKHEHAIDSELADLDDVFTRYVYICNDKMGLFGSCNASIPFKKAHANQYIAVESVLFLISQMEDR